MVWGRVGRSAQDSRTAEAQGWCGSIFRAHRVASTCGRRIAATTRRASRIVDLGARLAMVGPAPANEPTSVMQESWSEVKEQVPPDGRAA